jgi:hypothetical protein
MINMRAFTLRFHFELYRSRNHSPNMSFCRYGVARRIGILQRYNIHMSCFLSSDGLGSNLSHQRQHTFLHCMSLPASIVCCSVGNRLGLQVLILLAFLARKSTRAAVSVARSMNLWTKTHHWRQCIYAKKICRIGKDIAQSVVATFNSLRLVGLVFNYNHHQHHLHIHKRNKYKPRVHRCRLNGTSCTFQ